MRHSGLLDKIIAQRRKEFQRLCRNIAHAGNACSSSLPRSAGNQGGMDTAEAVTRDGRPTRIQAAASCSLRRLRDAEKPGGFRVSTAPAGSVPMLRRRA
jgi:hypothetical protein